MNAIRFQKILAQVDSTVGNREKQLAAFFGWAVLECRNSASPERLRTFLEKAKELISSALLNGAPLAGMLSKVEALPEIADHAFSETNPAAFQNPTFLESFVVYPFVKLFGGACRVRCYWINYDSHEYEGLISFGKHTDGFKGKTLPLDEPPYEADPILGTACHLLTSDAVERTYRTNPDILAWYRDALGLGNTVFQTYTWHLGEMGVLKHDDPFQNGVWAISFDLGHDPALQNRRTLQADLVTLQMLDALLAWAYADKLSVALYAARLKSDARGPAVSAAPRVAERLSAENAALSAPHQVVQENRSKSESRTNQATVESAGIAEQLARIVELASWFIPAGTDDTPWLFEKNDPVGVKVNAAYLRVCRALQKGGPASFTIVGPSGSGKYALISSLSEFRRGKSDKERHARPPLVIRANASEPRDLGFDMFGLDKGAYSSHENRASVLHDADDGIVRFPEFLRILCDSGRAVQGEWLDHVSGALKPQQWHQSYKEGKCVKPFQSKAILAFEGKQEHWDRIKATDDLSDWQRRLTEGGLFIEIPAWSSFSPLSHAVLLRWCLLNCLKRSGLLSGAYYTGACELLLKASSGLDSFGAKFVMNFVEGAFKEQSGKGVVVTELVMEQLRTFSLVSIVPSYQQKKPNDALMMDIGSDSPYAARLEPFERLVVDMYRKAKMFPTKPPLAEMPLYQKSELQAALSGVASNKELLFCHYLLLAAVRDVEPGWRDNAEDRFGTQYERISRFIANRNTAYEDACRTHTGYTPAQLQIRGSGNEKLFGETVFDPIIREHAGELQARVERIACAYPPFLHSVPFWLHPGS